MKVTRKVLKGLIFESLQENTRQLKLRGKTYSPKSFPIDDDDGEFKSKISKLLDNPEKELQRSGEELLSVLAPEEEAEEYLASRKRDKNLQQDPALYSAKLAAQDVMESLNEKFTDSDIHIHVNSFAALMGGSFQGSAHYDLIVNLSIRLGAINRNFLMKGYGSKHRYNDNIDVLNPEQLQKIDKTTNDLEDIFAASGYNLERGPQNFGGGEFIDDAWDYVNLKDIENEFEFSGVYQVRATSNVPIKV